MTNTEVSHAPSGYSPADMVSGAAKFRSDVMGHDAAAGTLHDPSAGGFFNFSKSLQSQANGLGFVPRFPTFHRVYNAAIGLFFVMLVLPLLAVISGILLIAQGRPIFYRGERMGQDGTRFHILKFRSLDSAKAAALTKDKVLAAGTGAETPVGMFLRETRLDELPQLLNVLLGDMNMCGPRPVRPEIADIHRADIPNYDERFNVKPGLLGPTQALMFHGTSKAIRSRLNYQVCRSYVSYRTELALVITVAACVAMRTISKTANLLTPSFISGRVNAAEALAERYDLRFEAEDGREMVVRAIDKSSIAIEGQSDMRPSKGRLVMTLPNGRKRSLRIVVSRSDAGTTDGMNLTYQPLTDLGEHVISRYLFQKVVVPHHSEFVFARMMSWLPTGHAKGQSTNS